MFGATRSNCRTIYEWSCQSIWLSTPFTMSQHALNGHTEDEKHDADMLEVGQEKARLESEFVDLTKWQIIWRFRKAVGICIAAMVAILLDGFALSLPGERSLTSVLTCR